MNNREAVLALLARHREARNWSDEAVADDLLTQLGLDPTADAKNAINVQASADALLAAQVAAAEADQKEAADRVAALRKQLDAVVRAATPPAPPSDLPTVDPHLNEQIVTNDQADADASAAIAKAAQDRRDAEAEDDARAAAGAMPIPTNPLPETAAAAPPATPLPYPQPTPQLP